MKIILKFICFCIFVTSINGTENLTELYESERSENYLIDNSSYKEIDEKFKLKWDFLGTENTTVLYESKHSEDNLKDISCKEIDEKFNYKLNKVHYDLKTLNIKTLELEDENFKLKERLTKTEENLKNHQESISRRFERLGEEQKETKEILKKITDSLENSDENLKRIEEEQKDTKEILEITKDDLKNTEKELDITDPEVQALALKVFGFHNTGNKSYIVTKATKSTGTEVIFNIKATLYTYFECREKDEDDIWVEKTEKGCRTAKYCTARILVDKSKEPPYQTQIGCVA